MHTQTPWRLMDALLGRTVAHLNDPSAPTGCAHCGEDEFSPNVEAFELSGEVVCDDCAEQVFEDNGQLGVGA